MSRCAKRTPTTSGSVIRPDARHFPSSSHVCSMNVNRPPGGDSRPCRKASFS
ncbi:hypothetical protein D8I24_4981 [Cupriavidus necator H850]|nr:hypothetical protein D8I24_4981 [Cupriavidus necator H850]